MKKIIILLTLFFITLTSYSQSIQFPPSILSTGGGTTVENAVHVAKWRLGRLNIFYIESEDLKSIENPKAEVGQSVHKIEVFPNPVDDWLNVRFSVDSKKQYNICLFDLSGKKLIQQTTQTILPDQIIRMDLSGHSPALYILRVTSSDYSVNRNFKISKH